MFLYSVKSALIGLQRVDPSQYGFEWIDGTSVMYLNWADGEPSNNGTEDCVVLDGNLTQWKDRACHALNWYMCQRQTGTVLL